jgi:hypothetical protein
MFFVQYQLFGSIWQANGPNDHPITITFLQVYKLLSVYSILKPPKTWQLSNFRFINTKINNRRHKRNI